MTRLERDNAQAEAPPERQARPARLPGDVRAPEGGPVTVYTSTLAHVLEHLDLALSALMVDHGRPSDAAQKARDNAHAATCHLRAALEGYPLPAPAAALMELDAALAALRDRKPQAAIERLGYAVNGLREEVRTQAGVKEGAAA